MTKPIDPKLAKFIAESKVRERMYHGTDKDIKAFRPGRVGTFVTPDPEFASKWATEYADEGRNKEGANVLPVHVQTKNPFDYENPKHVSHLRELAKIRFPNSSHTVHSEINRMVHPENAWDNYPYVENPDVQKLIKSAGHDAFYVSENHVKNLGIYDPRKIKSAIGNRGTYDPNDPDITKAGGGPVLPIGPSADIAAKLAALKEQMRQQGTNFDRRMQGVVNAEKTAGTGTVLPTDKAKGGLAHMAGGGHKELEEYIRQHEGQYGLHRLQRAQDEIHNLHGMYAPEALRQAFSGDNAKALMTMNPADFEKYAMQLKGNQTTGAITPSLEDRIKGQKARKTDLSTEDYVKYLQSIGKFSDVPYLQIDKEEVGLPLTPFISGHEGRHRNRAMASQGINRGLVVLHPRTELREPLPRRSREEYINALKEELAMTGNMVKPQQDKTNPRPAIQMPDIYAHGGSVTHAHHLDIEERPL